MHLLVYDPDHNLTMIEITFISFSPDLYEEESNILHINEKPMGGLWIYSNSEQLELYVENISRSKSEALIHTLFETKRLDLTMYPVIWSE